MLVALASVKASPGVTTAALALAARWPAHQRPVVVECDPAGGDLAVRFGLAADAGLVSLAAASRRDTHPELVWEHTQELPGGLEAVAGPVGAEQARAALGVLAAAGSSLWRAAGEPGTVVIADCGRLDPQTPTLPLLQAADVVLLVVGNEVDQLAHVAASVDALIRAVARPGRVEGRLGVLLVGEQGFGRSDVAEALGLPVLAVWPVDRNGAAALAGRVVYRWGLSRLPLLRHAFVLARDLAGPAPRTPAEAPGTSGSTAAVTARAEPKRERKSDPASDQNQVRERGAHR